MNQPNREYGNIDLVTIMRLQESGGSHELAGVTYGEELLNWRENEHKGSLDKPLSLVDRVNVQVSWGDYDTKSPSYTPEEELSNKVYLTKEQAEKVKEGLKEKGITQHRAKFLLGMMNLNRVLNCKTMLREQEGLDLYNLIGTEEVDFLRDPETYERPLSVFEIKEQ